MDTKKESIQYFEIWNKIKRDKRLSADSKYYLYAIVTAPSDWRFSVKGLSKTVKDGIAKTNRAIKELEKLGYLKRKRYKGESGTFEGCHWEIDLSPLCDFLSTENLSTEKPLTENHRNKEVYTKEVNTKEDNIKEYLVSYHGNTTNLLDYDDENILYILEEIEFHPKFNRIKYPTLKQFRDYGYDELDCGIVWEYEYVRLLRNGFTSQGEPIKNINVYQQKIADRVEQAHY